MNERRFVNQAFVGAAAVLLASAAQAGTIYVDDDNCPGPGSGTPGDPYCSIQTAIDNAVHTDQIVVAPGWYGERIDFLGKAITLRSTDGETVTFIDAEHGGVAVTCENGEGPDTVLRGFRIANGNGPAGGGMYNNGSSPTVSHCRFVNNTADIGGGMYNEGGSPTVTHCTFSNNEADNFGGGGMCNYHAGSPTITHCTFDGNSAILGGGGMLNESCSPTVANCSFSGNTADNMGGGVFNNNNSSPTITNCTLSDNTATLGGGMYNLDSSPTLIDCILWGDSLPEISDDNSTTTVMFSDIQGGWPGLGNIDADPVSVDAPGGDYRLAAGSPCIDAGMSLNVDIDLDGNRRAVDDPATPDAGIGCGGPVCDMGAYEFGSAPPCPADVDGNGTVNVTDFLLLLAGWGTCP